MAGLTQVGINPERYVVTLKQQALTHLADLRNTIRALEDESFPIRVAAPRPNAMVQIQIDSSVIKASDAKHEACKRCFLDLMRSFVTFLDRMIALKRTIGYQVALTKNLSSKEELREFIDSILESAYVKVAKDSTISNPKKLAEFPALPGQLKTIALSYFALRRCLEHHSSTPTQELRVPFPKMSLFADDEEIRGFPYECKAGTAIKMSLNYPETVFPASRKILLDEPQAEAAYFAVALLLAPAVKAALP